MFVYFLQKKGFLDDGDAQLPAHQARRLGQRRPATASTASFLKLLFFEGFAKPAERRTAEATCAARRRPLPQRRPVPAPPRGAAVPAPSPGPDGAFDAILTLFEVSRLLEPQRHARRRRRRDQPRRARLHLREVHQPEGVRRLLHARGDHRVPVRADHLPGHPRRVSAPRPSPASTLALHFDTIEELLLTLDAPLCRLLLLEILPALHLLDPACRLRRLPGGGAQDPHQRVLGRRRQGRVPGASPDPQGVAAARPRPHPVARLLHQEADHHRQPVRRRHHGGGHRDRQAAPLPGPRRLGAQPWTTSSRCPTSTSTSSPATRSSACSGWSQSSFDAKNRHSDMFRKGFTELVAEKNRLDVSRHYRRRHRLCRSTSAPCATTSTPQCRRPTRR